MQTIVSNGISFYSNKNQNFSRNPDLLRQFSELNPWRAFERELSGQLLRVYDLRAHLVRIDSTTGKTYAGVSVGGLFQFGHEP